MILHETINITWLGGAGFLLAYKDKQIALDLYLSDFLAQENGDFKRLTPSPLQVQDLKSLDYLICSHDHGDHFDQGSMAKLLEIAPDLKVFGPSSVLKLAHQLHMDGNRFVRLDRGEALNLGEIKLQAFVANHGALAPDAIGILLQMANKRIFFAGDSSFCEAYLDYTNGQKGFDLLLVAINGRYGNPNPKEAARIAQILEAKLTIPCHFWLLKEHGGDPYAFAKACAIQIPPVNYKMLAIGEAYALPTS